jgi:hypothetical protein
MHIHYLCLGVTLWCGPEVDLRVMIFIEPDWVSSAWRNVTSIQSSRTFIHSIWFSNIDRLSQGRVWGAFTVLDRIVPTCLRGDYWRWSSWRPIIGGRGGEGGETAPCAVDLSLLDLELHTHDCVWDLKVPKCEIFDRSDFHYFYTIKPFWIDDFGVKILSYFFKFWGSQASFSFLCASWAYA